MYSAKTCSPVAMNVCRYARSERRRSSAWTGSQRGRLRKGRGMAAAEVERGGKAEVKAEEGAEEGGEGGAEGEAGEEAGVGGEKAQWHQAE